MSTDSAKLIDSLAEVVAPKVLLDAIDTSRLLARLQIPHALVGGLAVGIHGHPRATKDVDFLVGTEAFETTEPILSYRDELTNIVRMGVIDLLSVPSKRPVLRASLLVPRAGELPVVDVRGLVLMKLDAGRKQDFADIHHLLDNGADIDGIGEFLAQHAPDLVDGFGLLLERRETSNRV